MNFDSNKLTLVSSNTNKLNEFKRFGLDLDIASGLDIREVDADSKTIAIYKAMDAGPKKIIEDTILIVDQKPMPDIRWKIQQLKSILPAIWVVTLAVHTGEEIQLFEGKIYGTIKPQKHLPDDAFGFDPVFIPEGLDMSLYQLEKSGKKDDYSARRIAVQNLIDGKFISRHKLDNIPAWTGKWQNS